MSDAADSDRDPEFAFELRVCRWAERAWHPDGPRPAFVARQLGTRQRRWDTVVVEVDPEAFAARRALSTDGFDSDLLRVVRHAPAEWAWYRDAIPEPDFPWRHVVPAVHRAAGLGLVEKRRGSRNRVEYRRTAPYPDWVERVVAIENKPNLDASAARALADQLDHDVSRALADEVWVATEVTGRRVEPALLEDLPVEVGILGVDGDSAEVLWHPSSLSPDPADARRRLVLAERAYDRGWRNYVDTMRPDCRQFELARRGRALVPRCAAKDCHQSQRECAHSCPSFEPEPPAWRMNGWPIEGGPGKGVRRILEARRERERDRAERGSENA
ncbi:MULTISPECIES: DUF5787 family protein [unclassified Haloferax]|uniref:DUF5787 family protein n=1 Tax=unclassified Haloferax TaxID=2625095 RepID=UPI0002B176C5|nr:MULTISPECIES: DUF5787 family protein [unclassified Haloferax]ELZ60078.1 hypothetical protein C460_04175 [Haloferax sp. ATCC BAA-646]ELZ64290.1 hypothetical protein C459_07165 [Haloferax sp. ATCC BAA-645]ELZ69874.1 hypothetical protein C458_06329 [Haloferax sp. ATCC BAA-644]